MKETTLFFLLISLIFSCSQPKKEVEPRRSNILLILADDMGYSDLGCYGSEIRTPNIDVLAKNGMLFSQFHAGVQCAPSRAMMISGTNNHTAGIGRQNVPANSKWVGKKNYERNLSDRIIPFPQLLQDAGYFTCMAGKWHLGFDPKSWPNKKGFDRSFSLINGGGHHYTNDALGLNYKNPEINFPGSDTLSLFVEDERQVKYPDGLYSTEFYTEKLLSYLDENKNDEDKPFFAFASVISPHWPLQVPEEWRNKYKGVYDEGYEALKEKRWKGLKNKGFIDKDTPLPDYAAAVKPWEDLTAEEQKIEARKMELYAAMVENLDFHVGKIIDRLKEMGEYENTLIFFLSDNGAAYRDFYAHPKLGKYLRHKFDNSYENMGSPTSYVSLGKAWAQSTMVPYAFHKSFPTEGGMIAPMISSGPGIEKNKTNHSYSTIMDLAPTFLEAASIEFPEKYQGVSRLPMTGESLWPVLSGKESTVHTDDYVVCLEFNNGISVRKGDWKLVNFRKPFRHNDFDLYYLPEDPSESNDLSKKNPEKYQELFDIWQAHVEEIGILLQDEDTENVNI